MSKENVNVFRQFGADVLSLVAALTHYPTSVIVGFNVNPFSWAWLPSCGVIREPDTREVYFIWLGLTVLLAIYRREGQKGE